MDIQPMTDDEKWQAEMRFKRLDLVLKVVSAVLVGGGMIAALIVNNRTLQQQHKLFQDSGEREWSRRLFDEKIAVYSKVSATAYRLKESGSQDEVAALLVQLQDLEAETVLLVPVRLMREIESARGAARRYVDTGQRDDRPQDGEKQSPDLTPSCVRIITECRKRILHARGIDQSVQESVEDAVSTAYGALEGS